MTKNRKNPNTVTEQTDNSKGPDKLTVMVNDGTLNKYDVIEREMEDSRASSSNKFSGKTRMK